MPETNIDLEVADLVSNVENMPEGDALACLSSVSSASCPAGTASTAMCMDS